MKNFLKTVTAIAVFVLFASASSYAQQSKAASSEKSGVVTTITMNKAEFGNVTNTQLKSMEQMKDFSSVTIDEATGKVVFKITRTMTEAQLKANVANWAAGNQSRQSTGNNSSNQ